MTETGKRVGTRRVFYIPGYDPFHPRRYRELYRTESAKQAAITGYSLKVSRKTGGGVYGWNADARIDGQDVHAAIDVLYWSDIVRSSMKSGILYTYVQMFYIAGVYIFSGTLFSIMRLRKGPVIAALYPIMMLLVQLALAVLAGMAVAGMLGWVLPWWAGVAGGVAAAVLVLQVFRRWDNKLFVYYLMHDYSFSARYLGANPPALEARLAEFADEIAAALKSDADEVLVVGHSSGAHLAVSILSDLIRQGRVPVDGATLSFLSLGHCIPMVSFLPRAARLRADLHYLSARSELTWVDVTAPGDGCAFALCDPVGVSGVAPANKRWPLVISAAFTKSLSPETWAALRWRFFRLHFQYMCAFDRPRDYDYFQITAGPITLGERFDGRTPSRSRIEAPASFYRTMAT